MAGENLPENVLHFLETCIDSVEQLRILLLLHSTPERMWTTAEITTELRSAESSIQKRLDGLYRRKVLRQIADSKDQHRFLPANDELRIVIEELAIQNQLRPYRVIEAIYPGPTRAIQAFTNAFKLKSGKP